MATPTFERWLWIELIGFDNTQPDFGVAAYLENAGFTPDAVSLLLFNADFIHDHDGMERDRELPYDCCSYAGRPHGVERDRQVWTSCQLRGLILELQSRGIAVCFAVFDLFVTEGWIGAHPEVRFVRRTGEQVRSICPWKRLADGSYYEEFFLAQLLRVMEDYGFDGFHGADGYAHPRIPISDGDFSDDMVAQFTAASGVALPTEVAGTCDGDPGRMAGRAVWIWRERRPEWIRFHVERTGRFWRKVVSALHARGKWVALNSIWTRDPFEAIYRYGVDYRALADAGVDALVVEAAAAASETERPKATVPVIHEFMATALLISACVPEMRLVPLNGVHDTREEWDVIRHAPTSLETEILSLANLYRHQGGRLSRCVSGFVVCLADSIRSHEWEWLQECWRLGFSQAPTRILGATLVWSPGALDRELAEFPETRRPATHRLLHSLIARGAPVRSVADVSDLEELSGPVLAIHPHLFPPEDVARLLAYHGGPILLVGDTMPPLPEPAPGFVERCLPDPLRCCVLGPGAATVPALSGETQERVPLDPAAIEEPGSFVLDLPCREVSEEFLQACARLIRECGGGVSVISEEESAKAWAMEREDGRVVVAVTNDSFHYVRAGLELGREIAGVRVLTDFPRMPVVPDGSRFRVRVPGRGMVVLEVELR